MHGLKHERSVAFLHPGASMVCVYEGWCPGLPHILCSVKADSLSPMCCASADGEDLASSLEHVALTSDVVLVPVNNNPFAEEAGGSHWSLLAYQRATHTFVHLDSMSSSGNKSVAATIADHLGAVLSGTTSEQRATPGGRAILPRCIVRVPLTACECRWSSVSPSHMPATNERVRLRHVPVVLCQGTGNRWRRV